MSISHPDELEGLKRIGRVVANTLLKMKEHARPGMTTEELDEFGRRLLEAAGARSAPQLFVGFPAATCISINEEVAHGLPGSRVLRDGDLVNIDVSAELDGFVADTGGSFVLGNGREADYRLLEATMEAMTRGIQAAQPGARLNGIGRAIERTAKERGFSIIRNLGSHGVGRSLHEEPQFIAGYYEPRDRRVLAEGAVITVEPFLSTGAQWAEEKSDGWTLATPKRFRTAQFEHTIVVTDGGPILVTVPG